MDTSTLCQSNRGHFYEPRFIDSLQVRELWSFRVILLLWPSLLHRQRAEKTVTEEVQKDITRKLNGAQDTVVLWLLLVSEQKWNFKS